MPSFAPVYGLRERKRKRYGDGDGYGDADTDADSNTTSDAGANHEDEDEGEDEHIRSQLPITDVRHPRIPYPVSLKDPYYMAGWPRNKPLPPGNFPHAAVAESRGTVRSKATSGEASRSLRRRHLDNLTALLHKCMLREDWQRASRIWGLILRTEIGGQGPDIRRHGRWMIGAELLMRRPHHSAQPTTLPKPSNVTDDASMPSNHCHPLPAPVIADEGFQLARAYYARLILQYPHLQRTHHSAISARVIYPALFNIWIYEVQDRSKRSRHRRSRASMSHNNSSEREELDDSRGVQSDSGDHPSHYHPHPDPTPLYYQQARNRELKEARLIAHRLNELLLNPPYDTSRELLELGGMVSLWLSSIHKDLAGGFSTGMMYRRGSSSDGEEESLLESRYELRSNTKWHEQQAEEQRRKARQTFCKMVDQGMQLSPENLDILQEDEYV